MTNHPITPPTELVEKWINMFEFHLDAVVLTEVAQWGSDQELLACGNYLEKCAAWEPEDVTEFYNYRRPKPPSLKEQALEAVAELEGFKGVDTIRRALEALDD